MLSLHNSASIAKTREPKDEQLCITVHIIQNIHDTDPLDKIIKHKKQALPYITSGLILDLKDRGGDPNSCINYYRFEK